MFNKALGAWAALHGATFRPGGWLRARLRDRADAHGRPAGRIGPVLRKYIATLDAPITECDSHDRGATRLRIPADGTADDLHNPPRIAPRHLFDLGIGVDNLLHTDRAKLRSA